MDRRKNLKEIIGKVPVPIDVTYITDERVGAPISQAKRNQMPMTFSIHYRGSRWDPGLTRRQARRILSTYEVQKGEPLKNARFSILGEVRDQLLPAVPGRNEGGVSPFATKLLVPPLTLLVNPEDVRYTYAKRYSEEFTGAVIPELWGDELDTFSASGRSGGFFTEKTGLTTVFRRGSFAFQNLFSLYLIYRNNGWTLDAKLRGRINTVGAVSVLYDSALYVGSFSRFTISEDATTPFWLNYSFDFTVRKTHRLK